jgi:two-component system, CitB family, sensor kinase
LRGYFWLTIVLLVLLAAPWPGESAASTVSRVQRPRIRFAHQILALQVGVVVLVVGVGFLFVGYQLRAELTNQYLQRALAVAHAIAADRDIWQAAEAGDPRRVVQDDAEAARVASGALFVVVTDRQGIRLSHPNPEQIGKRVSTDPSKALAGQDDLSVDRGTLGVSARAKVPMRNESGTVVGEVSVGFAVEEISTHVARLIGWTGLFLGGALLLGVAGSAALSRRLRRLTLGLEPHELAEMVQEREAVLHGVKEGVLAVDPAGRVSVSNDEASRLLGVRLETGKPIDSVELPARIRAAISDGEPVDNLITVAGNRVLVVNHRPVRREHRNLGGVLTLRDRTDLEALTRELDAVRALTGALRAQRHEFANRLHVLSGLLQTGHTNEAIDYLATVSAGPIAGPVSSTVKDPYLQAFLGAKTAEATEKAVQLRLAETSWVPGRISAPAEVTTVLGNLVDNALEAARLGRRRPAWVEVDLLADGEALHLTVLDSGDGVPDALRDKVFDEGVSTRDGADRGLGLVLARQAARSKGGDVSLAAGHADNHGAVFVARLPGVVAAAGPPEVVAVAGPPEVVAAAGPPEVIS